MEAGFSRVQVDPRLAVGLKKKKALIIFALYFCVSSSLLIVLGVFVPE